MARLRVRVRVRVRVLTGTPSVARLHHIDTVEQGMVTSHLLRLSLRVESLGVFDESGMH